MMHFGLQELTVNEINAKFSEYMSCQDNAESAANYIYDSLVEDLTMGLLFEFHHGLKTGLTDLLEGEPEHEEPLLIVNTPDCDVFGLSATKKTPDCNCCCPHCERTVSATRFAPHLEKCMGMGRNSSRIASRRIASNSKEPALYAGIMSDDDDDVDWVGGDRKKKKIRSNGVKKLAKLNNGSSKVTATNGGSSDGASSSQDTGGATFDTMTPNERKSLLLHVCGVVSEHTKKICTRSIRCPQHTEEQRKALRSSVLESVASLDHNTGDGSTPLTPNDVGSPPDSSPSSSCSSSSRKRDKHRSKSSKGRREKTNYSPGRE